MNKRQAKKRVKLSNGQYCRFGQGTNVFGYKTTYGPFFDFPSHLDCKALRKRLLHVYCGCHSFKVKYVDNTEDLILGKFY